MIRDLIFQLEQKVEHAVDLIELLRLQIEDLEEQNTNLRGEQEKWRGDLVNLINRFEQIDPAPSQCAVKSDSTVVQNDISESV